MGRVQQAHMGFFKPATSFLVIAGRTGGNHIGPGVWAMQVAWYNVVNGKDGGLFAAILTSIIIAAKNFFSAQFNVISWTMHHVL